MDRRRFLQTVVASTAVLDGVTAQTEVGSQPRGSSGSAPGAISADMVSTKDHALICSFSRGRETWKVYEDLRTRDGVLTFVSSEGHARILGKRVEAVFPEEGPQYLGLDLKEICLAGPDLLADRLLAKGDPDEAEVRRAAPPMNSAAGGGPGWRPRWDTIVGTVECGDTMPVYPGGNTRTYHPVQYFPELTPERSKKRHDGLVGGWMPAVRKVMPAEDGSWFEVLVFGDVLAKDRLIVQTWHRTAHIRDGRLEKVEYGYSYPAYTRRRQPPPPEAFYRGLLEFAEYWERALHDSIPLTLPDDSWSDMVRYAFVKESMVRPGGVYPKYGAVDRDYYGPEYDGFQDIFTMSLYANLECGRFQLAHDVFDNYFTDFIDEKGMINMRGAETAQYGLTLLLVALYYRYTKDAALLRKHRQKIEAMAMLLAELHEEALKLPPNDRGHGLIHGWCESDACLHPNPAIWWKPYYANSAFAIRGWRELVATWTSLRMTGSEEMAANLRLRCDTLQRALVESIAANTWKEEKPAYIGPLPGTKMHFRDALAKERPSEEGWTHRCYAELLQADVLPAEQANLVIDCMRAYGATTIGVVANVESANPNHRAILGFISYGYAQALLRLDRIEEYILFLYAHRYHDHSRGGWTAGEVSGITGDDALFCIPAQQTIPLLIRWMLVFEDADGERLHLGRAIPRKWIGSGRTIAIEDAPTRWGRVSYRVGWRSPTELVATISLPQSDALLPALNVRFRLPEGLTAESYSSDGKPVTPDQVKDETVTIVPGRLRRIEVIARVRE